MLPKRNRKSFLECLEGRRLLSVETTLDFSDSQADTVIRGEFTTPRVLFESAIPYGGPTARDASWPFNQQLDYSGITFRAALEAGTAGGDQPDSPALRADPNDLSGRFGGVGSIEISVFGTTIVCSGALIGEQHVLTAAHCFDLDSDGLADPLLTSQSTFNLNDTGSPSQSFGISQVDVYEDFGGFTTTGAFDDLAVLTLSSPVSPGTPIYDIVPDSIEAGQEIELVGYGISGFGDVLGEEVIADPFVKRSGKNVVDLFVSDDEGTGRLEVFIYDFDGPSGTGILGGPSLGNQIETIVRSGDSGGPVFVEQDGVLAIVGVSTFEFSIEGVTESPGEFGAVGGGSIIGDAEFEWIESVLNPGSGESEPDPAPIKAQVNFLVDSGKMPESKAKGKLTVFRQEISDEPLTVQYLVGGTATPDDDYLALSGSLTIPAGSIGERLYIEPVDDLAFEGDETVTITLLPTDDYYVIDYSKVSVVLADDDPDVAGAEVSFSEVALDVEEGETAYAKLFRSGRVDDGLTVRYTVSGDATVGIDYQQLTGTAEFQPGSVSATIPLATLNDVALEQAESVVIEIDSGDGYSVGQDAVATVRILDDDDVPTVTVTESALSVSESAGTASFEIQRSGYLDVPITIHYEVTGSAVAGQDYEQPAGVVEIPAGAAMVTIPIALLDDGMNEEDESIVLTVTESDSYNIGSPATSTLTVVDDDLPVVEFTATALGVFENGDDGHLVIRRIGAVTEPLTVQYSVEGTATPGVDYAAVSGSATFAAGSDTAAIDISPIDDITDEANETVLLTLIGNSEFQVGDDGSTLVTILDNDLPLVSLASPAVTQVSESGDALVFTVTRAGDTSIPLIVNYSVAGSAAAGSDYAALPGSITIPVGADSANILVDPVDDSQDEPDETVVVSLEASAAYARAADSTATATIVDNDEVVNDEPDEIQEIFLDVLDAETIREGDPGANTVARFQVQVRGGGTFFHPIYVYMSTVDRSAKSGSDFEFKKLERHTIPANTNSITIEVPIIEDNIREGTEIFQFQLVATAATDGVAPGKVKVGDGFGLATITDDD